VANDLKLAGIQPPPTAAANSDDEDDFELWEENLESWEWFIKMGRRWVFNSFDGSRIRFDDVAIQVQFEIHGIKKSKRKNIMDDLLAMEAAALEVLNTKEADRE
jgi:hypothetical protein